MKLLTRLFLSAALILWVVHPVNACPQLTPIRPVTSQEHDIYTSLLKGFSIYESFVSERDVIDDLLFPVHGHSIAEAESYLQKGFTCSLTNNILLTYTRWNQCFQRLQLIPSDGIPILTEADFNDLSFKTLDDGSIVFQRDYRDCYQSGDRYHFQVTGHKSSSGWLIQSFTLTECTSPSSCSCESL